MAKQTLETFTQKVIEKHGEKFDFSKSEYSGLDKEITYICPVHGEVSQIAKKVLTHTGCPLCDQEKAKKSRKGGKYAKTKGSNYELKIIHELEALGYQGLKSARSQSKNLDNAKVDIAETIDKLPFYVQNKCTKNTPNYFKIQEECPLTDRELVLFWNRQEVKEGQVNMSSKGEVVFVPKDLFYKLLKAYKEIS